MGNVLLGQGLVTDDFIQPVQKLRPEGALEQLVHLSPGLGAHLPVLADAVQQILRTQVGGQNQDGVLKVYRSPLTVGNSPIVQYLQ